MKCQKLYDPGSTHGRVNQNPQVLPVEQTAELVLKEWEPLDPLLTAKEEIFFFTSWLLQSGQRTWSVEKPSTNDSKGFPQSWQMNS